MNTQNSVTATVPAYIHITAWNSARQTASFPCFVRLCMLVVLRSWVLAWPGAFLRAWVLICTSRCHRQCPTIRAHQATATAHHGGRDTASCLPFCCRRPLDVEIEKPPACYDGVSESPGGPGPMRIVREARPTCISPCMSRGGGVPSAVPTSAMGVLPSSHPPCPLIDQNQAPCPGFWFCWNPHKGGGRCMEYI